MTTPDEPDDDRAELTGATWAVIPIRHTGGCGCPDGAPIEVACLIAAIDAVGRKDKQ